MTISGSFSFILIVYRVLEAFSLNATLIFTLIIIIIIIIITYSNNAEVLTMLEFRKPLSRCCCQTGLFSQLPKSNKTCLFHSRILHKLCTLTHAVHGSNAVAYINELLNNVDSTSLGHVL